MIKSLTGTIVIYLCENCVKNIKILSVVVIKNKNEHVTILWGYMQMKI